MPTCVLVGSPEKDTRYSFLALFSGAIGDRLEQRPGAAGAIGKAADGVLVALGVRLAFSGAR